MKILITGFNHSGTSILRKIIGNHRQVDEIIREVGEKRLLKLAGSNLSGNIVMKSPNLNKRVMQACRDARNIKIVCITRDPRDSFTSLKERYRNEYSFEKFKKTYLECSRNSIEVSSWKNGYLVRYEDLFKDNYKELKNIFAWLGLTYHKSLILNNSKRIGLVSYDKLSDKQPPRTDNNLFRSWQINQPFIQNSGRYINRLSKKELKYFKDPDIKQCMLSLGYLNQPNGIM